MKKKEYLNGNQSVARGFYEAGGHLAAGYPGTPTSETIQFVQENYKEIYAEYSQNEVVAMEMAAGASIAGGRVMFNSKQLGLNVALDSLMTFTQAHINGGFLYFVADDPELTGSQNEQDSRFLGKYANSGVICPSNQQEMKDFTKIGLELSETFDLPILLRATTPTCQGYGLVDISPKTNIPIKPYEKNLSNYCMFPPYASKAQFKMKESLAKLEEYAYDTNLNTIEVYNGNKTLIITAGYMYPLVKELNPPASILKLGLVYPISTKKIKELAEVYDKIVVCEELLPFIEDEIKIKGVPCKGKEYFSFTGQLTIRDVAIGLIDAGIMKKSELMPCMKIDSTPVDTVPRTPLFFSGCPHRPIFDVLRKTNALIVGDIGCYTIGTYFPWQVNEINLNMGSAPAIIKGVAEIFKKKHDETPLVALIGDGTFYHSAMLSILNLLEQEPNDSNITIIILNNGTTALTAWEANAGTGNYARCKTCSPDKCNSNKCNIKDSDSSKIYSTICGDICLKPKDLLENFGFNDVTEIDQFDFSKLQSTIKDCTSRKGIKFIIPIRPCIVAFKVQKPTFKVDENKCIACKKCVQLACQPIKMKEYENQPIKKSFIDPVLCTGCSLCAQVCPVNAISQCK